jgi:ribose 5-phosphate isomerase A
MQRVSPQNAKDRAEREKRVVAEAAVRLVKPNMKLGLGSGSTSHYFIELLGERVRRGELTVEAVASSKDSETLARQAGILLTEPRRGLRLDLAVDGADEIAPDLSLIKGGGGAHLREKVVAAAAAYFLVIGDSSKLVPKLGSFPVPIEVVPFATPWIMDRIQEIGGNPALRMEGSSTDPCLTDQQNYILDCGFGVIEQPAQLACVLEKIPGIVAHGLFIGYARAALIAQDSQAMLVRPGEMPTPITNFEKLP